MLNSFKEELKHAHNPFILKAFNFTVSNTHEYMFSKNSLVAMSPCSQCCKKAFYQLDPGTLDVAILEPCYVQNTFALLLPKILKNKTKTVIGSMENHQRIDMNLYLKPFSSSPLYSSYVFLHLLQTLHKDHLHEWKPFT